MDKFERYNDLASLLDDNTANKREGKTNSNSKGNFLSALQRSKSLVPQENKQIFTTTTSDDTNYDETNNQKRGIDKDNNTEAFDSNVDFRRNNSVLLNENKNFINSTTNANSEPFDENRRNRSTTEKILDRSKIDEQLNLNNLLGRRRSQLISSREFPNSVGSLDKITEEPSSNFEIKSETRITTPKVEEEAQSDFYIPTLTKNSRRARGSIMKQIEEKESRDNSTRKDDSFDTLRDKSASVGEKKEISSTSQIQSSSPIINKLQIDKLQINQIQESEITQDKSLRGGIKFNESPNNVFKYASSNGEINLSFRGDLDNVNIKESVGFSETISPKKQDSLNLQEINFKLNADKDYLLTQLSIHKQRLEEDRTRYERQLEDERQNTKRKENEYKNFIEEIKRRHKDELIQSENRNKSVINSLNEEIRRIRNDVVMEIQNEKERITMLHQSDLDNREIIYKQNFEMQKKNFEEEIENLKKQLEKQTEMGKIAVKVENSSQQIEDILQKFYKEKELALENERNHLLTRKRFLLEKEDKIKENENQIQLEREKINQLRKDFELKQLEKKKEIQEEKQRIEREISKLQELQNSFKTIEFNSKEKYEREKLEFTQKQSDLKKEHEELKREFIQKMKELDNDKKIFEEEKIFFEKYKEEAIKAIELRKLSIEERKNKFQEEEKEIKSRIKVLQDKEYFLKDKFEEFENLRKEIHEEGKKLEQDRTSLITAARRLEEGINSLEENRRHFEQEKGEYIRKFQECEIERSQIHKEKIKIEQAKAELRLRIQSVDMMRMQYVSGNLSTDSSNGLNIHSDLKSASISNFNKLENKYNEHSLKYTNNNFGNANVAYDSNYFQGKSSFKKSFNADEYLQSFQMKMKLNENTSSSSNNRNSRHGDFNNYFMKEQEYLKKSNEDFMKSFKKDYDKELSNNKINANNLNLNNSLLTEKKSSIKDAYIEMKDNSKNLVEVKKNLSENKKENENSYIEYENKYPMKVNDITDESIIMNNRNNKFDKSLSHYEPQNKMNQKNENEFQYKINENKIQFNQAEVKKNTFNDYQDDDDVAELDDF